MTTATATFDRYDITEAYYILACNWGLYGILTRLSEMHFKPSPYVQKGRLFALTYNGRAIYHDLDRRLSHALYVERRDLPDLHIAPSLKGYNL